jgi:hypothetical protein
MIVQSRRRHAGTAGLLVLCWVSSAGGCGSGAPYAESSQTEATVSGRVTLTAKPVAKGQVIFDPSNVNRPKEAARIAEISEDGTYLVKTLIGANRVTVAIPGHRAKAGSPYVQRTVDVRSGSNTFDIAIP